MPAIPSSELAAGFLPGAAIEIDHIAQLALDGFEAERQSSAPLTPLHQIDTDANDAIYLGAQDGRIVQIRLNNATQATDEYTPSALISRTALATAGITHGGTSRPDGRIVLWGNGLAGADNIAVSDDFGQTWTEYRLVINAVDYGDVRRIRWCEGFKVPRLAIDGLFVATMDEGATNWISFSTSGLEDEWSIPTQITGVLEPNPSHFDAMGGCLLIAGASYSATIEGVVQAGCEILKCERLGLNRTDPPEDAAPVPAWRTLLLDTGTAMDIRGLVANPTWGVWCLMTHESTTRRIFTSRDGEAWELRATWTGTDDLQRHQLVSVGPAIVASSPGVLVYSFDGGETWHQDVLALTGTDVYLSEAHGQLFVSEDDDQYLGNTNP